MQQAGYSNYKELEAGRLEKLERIVLSKSYATKPETPKFAANSSRNKAEKNLFLNRSAIKELPKRSRRHRKKTG
ncbi:MAG: hypothetical protein MZU97_10900 [Bacillus subtilis]|nr:hypothetical protein [Bacillus subtilis]